MSKTRPYNSERRAAAATATRAAILTSAKALFEARTWTGATIPLIAAQAGVSVSSIEAIYKTKAGLLSAVVDFSIRGDAEDETMDRRQVFAEIRDAPDARTMLKRHAAYVRTINQRSASIGWIVEQAAHHDPAIGELWQRMNRNRNFGANAAAEALMTKPGIRPGLTHPEAANVFWLAIDWSTYRSLTTHRGLTPQAFEDWIHHYYRRLLL
jgi:TetR/AcrR family transcriptional regulator, regulator of autoinduction and epiphytic fitness